MINENKNKNEIEIIKLLKEEGFNSRIDNGNIVMERCDLPKLECGCRINDLLPKLTKPKDISRFLIGKYNLKFSDQIDIINKINRRNNLINTILST